MASQAKRAAPIGVSMKDKTKKSVVFVSVKVAERVYPNLLRIRVSLKIK